MAEKDVEPDGAERQQPAAPHPPMQETDDFGLPIRQFSTPVPDARSQEEAKQASKGTDAAEGASRARGNMETRAPQSHNDGEVSDGQTPTTENMKVVDGVRDDPAAPSTPKPELEPATKSSKPDEPTTPKPQSDGASKPPALTEPPREDMTSEDNATTPVPQAEEFRKPEKKRGHAQQQSIASIASMSSATGQEGGLSEFSHQQLSMQPEPEKENPDEGWQTMPSYARYDMYDDDDRLIAKEYDDQLEDEVHGYSGLGGAGKGYTRVQMDEDAQSANSMDDNTQYLFKDVGKGTGIAEEDDEDTRDALSQMQATKDLLTEGQRIAYVGVVRLEIAGIVKEAEELEQMRSVKKVVNMSMESTKMWGQKMMIRVYAHMDISEAEQVMIEQLAEHGVVPGDLVPALHANARVKNPMAGHSDETNRMSDDQQSPAGEGEEEMHKDDGQVSTKVDGGKAESASPNPGKVDEAGLPEYSPMPIGDSNSDEKAPETPGRDEEKPAKAVSFEEEEVAEPPPPYQMNPNDEVPDVQTPSQMPSTAKIDIDLRWTILCDLFLLLVADSVYDARSRVLLERVAKSLEISWTDICRFEKRVTDALEMQQAADKENWNEDEHMESRRKRALRKRYMMLGLATVGGGLVIGLSAGLLAPMIGAGLAAGFTTIGVGGTSGFLGGVGGAAMITSGAAATGSVIGGRAAHRRTGAVRTFEYRPLHNNKRVNLIVTVSGWLTGKVDDVRLPFSTVDSTMGDIYSVLWEPEMLQSIGDTIRILATEALTQSIQQVLGSTILAALMGALQLPIILTKLSYLIDNPWAVSLDRATAAGKILADSLIERNLGTRPITLVGYSLGSRVIFSCLQELAKRGAYGLVQNVYLFGSPVVYKKEEYLRARTVVPGRFVNGYNRTDWVLGYLFRLTNGGIRRVAGLAAIDGLPWIENMDCTEYVNGHMEYRTAMPTLLIKAGWMVESDEFTEIEDPDPENHNARQRELINEIEEARKKLEEEGKQDTGKKSKFSIFGRKKKLERQEWELYEDTKDKPEGEKKTAEAEEEDRDAAYRGALFDVDAIRAELAKEAEQGRMEDEIQIKEIKSTLPPMKLDISNMPPSSSSTPTATSNPYGSLRETRSADHVPIHYPPEDEVSMTFDTAFDDHNETRNLRGDSLAPPSARTDDYSSRPDLKSSQTVPNVTLNNPWGDPDDEDFGKEKEISMTFA